MKTPKHVKDLVADPRNRRRHTPRNVDMIVESLQRVGASRSIVIDEQNEILAGNGVVEACAQAGITKLQVVDVEGDTVVAVRRRGLTPAQKRDLAIADNRSAELAEWNLDQLAADLQNGEDLTAFFLPDELTKLLADSGKTRKTSPDQVPAERPTSIVAGDLFELGPHRLLCGDCLDAAIVDRLIAPATQVATVVTSPPYWTGQPYDDKPGELGVRAFVAQWCQVWAPRVRRRIQIQTGHTNNTLIGDPGPLRKILLDSIWADALRPVGWLLRHRRCWAKGGGLGGFTGPLTDLIEEAWEVILTFYRPGHNEGGLELNDMTWAQQGVWSDIAGEHGDDGHPCPFPVALADRLIRLYSTTGDLVADPFAGSGTTLIACERIARACLAIELSPAYCQVIVDRWELFTGQKAVKVGDAPARKRKRGA